MPPADEAREARRKRRTMILIIGGAASLLLPLLGVVYIKMTDKTVSNSLSIGSAVFDRRDALSTPRVAPSAAQAPSAAAGAGPSAQSGLSLVRTSEDIAREPDPAALAAAAASAAPPPPPPPPSAPSPAPVRGQAKNQPRPWAKPGLQASPFAQKTGSVGGGFAGRGQKFSGAGLNAGGPQAGAAPAGMPDIGAMMQGAGAGSGATPDIEALLKGIPGAAPPAQ